MGTLHECFSRLERLNDDEFKQQDGIESFTKLALGLEGREDKEQFTKDWLERLQDVGELWEEQDLLVFVYLANHIILTSLNYGEDFKALFQKVLPEAFEILKENLETTEGKVLRVLDIWAQRQVYHPSFIGKLRDYMKTEQTVITPDSSEDEDSDSNDDEVEVQAQVSRQGSTASTNAIKEDEMLEDILFTRNKVIALNKKKKELEKELQVKINIDKISKDLKEGEKNISDAELSKIEQDVSNISKCAEQINALSTCAKVLTDGYIKKLEWKMDEAGEKMYEETLKLQKCKDMEKSISDLLQANPTGVIFANIVEVKQKMKRKHPSLKLAEEKKRKQELEEKRRREAEKDKPMVWCQLTKRMIPAPQIGTVEDWRYR